MNIKKYISIIIITSFFFIFVGCASTETKLSPQDPAKLCKAEPVDVEVILDGLVEITETNELNNCAIYSTIDWILAQESTEQADTRKMSCKRQFRVCTTYCKDTFYPNVCVQGCYKAYVRCRRTIFQ